jgi:hypothetical protein
MMGTHYIYLHREHWRYGRQGVVLLGAKSLSVNENGGLVHLEIQWYGLKQIEHLQFAFPENYWEKIAITRVFP